MWEETLPLHVPKGGHLSKIQCISFLSLGDQEFYYLQVGWDPVLGSSWKESVELNPGLHRQCLPSTPEAKVVWERAKWKAKQAGWSLTDVLGGPLVGGISSFPKRDQVHASSDSSMPTLKSFFFFFFK